MSALNQTSEPSMEEILASIRKIISDDSGVGPDQEAPHGHDEDEDVLELTEVLDDASLDGADILQNNHHDAHDDLSFQRVLDDVNEERVQLRVGVHESTPDEEIPLSEAPQTDSMESMMTEQDNLTTDSAESDVDLNKVDAMLNQVQQVATSSAHDIISPMAAMASLSALSALDRFSATKAPVNAPPPMEGEFAQKTAETLVHDIMRPLLKEWLDANLPSLVKWIVTEQVEKLIKERNAQ